MKTFTHRSTFRLALLVAALGCLTITGCREAAEDAAFREFEEEFGSGGTTANTSTDGGDTSDTALNTITDEPVDFEFADLVKPFDPPPLEEIISGNEWADKPVLDAVELMRERQAGEQQLATPAEALALKNSSVANNNKAVLLFSTMWKRIVSKLGFLRTTLPSTM